MFPSRRSQVRLHRLITQTSQCLCGAAVDEKVVICEVQRGHDARLRPHHSSCRPWSKVEQLLKDTLVLVFKPAVYSVISLRRHTLLLLKDYKRWKVPPCWFPDLLSTSDNDIFSVGISAGCEEPPKAVCVCKDPCVSCVSRSPLC